MGYDIDRVWERTKAFYEKPEKRALFQIVSIAELATPEDRPLNQWDFPADMKPYLDGKIEALLSYWDGRKSIDDDAFPMIHPWFGVAEHSSFIGGEVEFSEETSWHKHLITDWCMLDELELREDNKWLRMIIDGLDYLRSRAEGRYYTMLRGAEAPMDIANALRGNELFTDFYLHPVETHRLMEFCAKAAAWTLEHQRVVVENQDIHGGTMTGYHLWVPGRAAGHLSEDASVMCSPETYREFGLPYTRKLIAPYDAALMHSHAAGVHNIPLIAEMDGISVIQISNDPGQPRAIEIYKQIADSLKGKIIVLKMTEAEIHDNLEFLSGRKTVIRYEARSLEDASRVGQFVRDSLG